MVVCWRRAARASATGVGRGVLPLPPLLVVVPQGAALG